MTHKKIQMNPKLKEMRIDILKSFEDPDGIKNFASKSSKEVRAEMVYRFHIAGMEVGKLCGMFGISPGYQRELRQLKEDKWKINLLNGDEEFLQYLEELKLRNIKMEDGSPEEYSFLLILYQYIMTGLIDAAHDIKSSDLMYCFDEMIKHMTDNDNSKPQEKPIKNVEVQHPCQLTTFQPPNENQNINDIRGMMGYV